MMIVGPTAHPYMLTMIARSDPQREWCMTRGVAYLLHSCSATHAKYGIVVRIQRSETAGNQIAYPEHLEMVDSQILPW